MSSLRVGRRRSAILPTLVIVAVLIVAFAVFTSVWTDRLWYGSFGYASVFSKMLLTRIGLFIAFGLIMATCVVANAAIAYRLRPRLGAQVPSSPLLERYREMLESRFVWVLVAIGAVVGLFAGGAASGRALDYLAWQNSTPFNITDPRFGLDVGFFVFAYPWWRFVLSFIFTALVFSTIVAAIVHYTMGGLRFSGPRRGGSRAAQAHLSILVGLAVLVSFSWLTSTRATNAPTGCSPGFLHRRQGHSDRQDDLAIIAATLLFFSNAVLRRGMVPTIGLVLLLLSAIVLGLVYPGAVQYFSVRPDEPDKERAYITRNIEATRAAYGVDKVEITDYSAKTTVTAGQLRADAEALPGIRLIDPNVIGPTFEQLQQVRGYYEFPKILDVDRYTIGGKETDAVVAVREMDLSGVEDNWNNRKTVYTHGYGLVAAYGNRRQPGGEPEWMPGIRRPVRRGHQPRLFRRASRPAADQYSIVDAGWYPAHRVGHAGWRRGREPEDLHLHRQGWSQDRQHVESAALRREVCRRQHLAV